MPQPRRPRLVAGACVGPAAGSAAARAQLSQQLDSGACGDEHKLGLPRRILINKCHTGNNFLAGTQLATQQVRFSHETHRVSSCYSHSLGEKGGAQHWRLGEIEALILGQAGQFIVDHSGPLSGALHLSLELARCAALAYRHKITRRHQLGNPPLRWRYAWRRRS